MCSEEVPVGMSWPEPRSITFDLKNNSTARMTGSVVIVGGEEPHIHGERLLARLRDNSVFTYNGVRYEAPLDICGCGETRVP